MNSTPPSPELQTVIQKFLQYAFRPIHYSYDELTALERTLCTREEFEELVKWVQELNA
jgi:hypothetical protein